MTARKIDAAAARLGYVPGDRRKRKRSPSVVAVLFSGIKLQYYSDALKILIEESRRYDYRFLLIPVTDGDEQWKKIFTDLQITGVIYLEEDLNPDIRNYIKAKNIKTVMFGDSSQDRRSKMIHVNDLAAARAGCQYLLSLRHRRILILSDAPQKISTGFQRIVGCRRAFEEMGAEFSEDLLKYGELTWEEGRFLVRQALKQNLKFTAVFAFSDEMAMGAISALKEAGLSVPGDVSVMGFDGLGLSKKIVPRLTTVEQPMKKMAEIALDSFLSAESEDNLESIVPYKIEEGETCREVE